MLTNKESVLGSTLNVLYWNYYSDPTGCATVIIISIKLVKVELKTNSWLINIWSLCIYFKTILHILHFCVFNIFIHWLNDESLITIDLSLLVFALKTYLKV